MIGAGLVSLTISNVKCMVVGRSLWCDACMRRLVKCHLLLGTAGADQSAWRRGEKGVGIKFLHTIGPADLLVHRGQVIRSATAS